MMSDANESPMRGLRMLRDWETLSHDQQYEAISWFLGGVSMIENGFKTHFESPKAHFALNELQKAISYGRGQQKEQNMSGSVMNIPGVAKACGVSEEKQAFKQFETGAVRGTDHDACFLELIPPEAMRAIGRAFAEGIAKGYHTHGWLSGFPFRNLVNHAMHHLLSILEGDTSEDHCGHLLWNVSVLCHQMKHRPELNDLPPYEKFSKQISFTPTVSSENLSEQEAKREAGRYLFVRKLNARQFTELCTANIRGVGTFDDLVDSAESIFESGDLINIDMAISQAIARKQLRIDKLSNEASPRIGV